MMTGVKLAHSTARACGVFWLTKLIMKNHENIFIGESHKKIVMTSIQIFKKKKRIQVFTYLQKFYILMQNKNINMPFCCCNDLNADLNSLHNKPIFLCILHKKQIVFFFIFWQKSKIFTLTF